MIDIKKSIALSFWLSHPKLHWLMWKVCAEPTTSAGVGLWKRNSHEERPNSPVTPNPPAAGPPLCLIPPFSPVHHLRMLGCEHCRRRRGQEAGEVCWWREGSQSLGWQSKHLGSDRMKEVNQTGSNCKLSGSWIQAPSNLFLSACSTSITHKCETLAYANGTWLLSHDLCLLKIKSGHMTPDAFKYSFFSLVTSVFVCLHWNL